MNASDTLKRGLFHLFGALTVPLAAFFLTKTVFLISLGVVTFIVLAFELITLPLFAGLVMVAVECI